MAAFTRQIFSTQVPQNSPFIAALTPETMSHQSQTCKEVLEQAVASGVDPDSDDWHDFFVKYAVK
jgi:hypothetical protein